MECSIINILGAGDTTLLFCVYALLALAKGERTVLEDVRDAWAVWMSAQNPLAFLAATARGAFG